MDQDAILKVVNEKIDERMRNMFRMGDRPVEIEMGQIAGAYIDTYSVARPLLSTISRDSDEAMFMERNIDVGAIRAVPIHRRDTMANHETSISSSNVEDNDYADTDCVVMSPHLYANLCKRGLGENWKTKPLEMKTERKRNAARIVHGGRSISVHLTERAGDKVYILQHPEECGVRADTGNPLVICEPEPKKFRASIIGIVEFGVKINPTCCRILQTSESFVETVV